MVKYGKLGEEKPFCGNPFKKPFIVLKPGAVLAGFAYADTDVIQYAFAFPVLFP